MKTFRFISNYILSPITFLIALGVIGWIIHDAIILRSLKDLLILMIGIIAMIAYWSEEAEKEEKRKGVNNYEP